MALVTSTEMFKKAYDGGYAIGAFNVNNMEIIQGITEAAAELQAPLILQVSKGARAYANRTYLKKLVEAAVIETGLPIVLHLDHGDSFETCKLDMFPGRRSYDNAFQQSVADNSPVALLRGKEENANSAIVVNVTPEDFAADGFADYGVLAGVEFQKKYEHLAYEAGNGKIPVQLFADYKANRVSTEFGSVKPNIRGGYQFANLNKCLPAYINDAIIEGILDYDRKLKGFSSGDAVLSGIESRTSSPVRIVRDETYRSDYAGLFPCGEGAGYAGGITSAAVDGIKVAEAVAAYINNIV